MVIETRYFGKIDVDEQKILTFEDGLIGFEYLKKFTLIYNNETEASGAVTAALAEQGDGGTALQYHMIAENCCKFHSHYPFRFCASIQSMRSSSV